MPVASFAQKTTDAQRKEQLELQMQKLKKDIALMEKSMQVTSKKKRLTQQEVNFIREQIAEKEKEISVFKKAANAIGKDIKLTETEIDNRTTTLNELKRKYAFVLQQVYRNSMNTNKHHSFIEQNYLSRIADYRKAQARVIKGNINELENKKTELEEDKKETEAQLKTQAQLKNKLETDEEKKAQEVAKLTEKEKKTKEQIELKNKAAQRLNQTIRKIIEKEIRIAREKAAALAAKSTTKSTTTVIKKAPKADEAYLSPQEMALSNDFSSNQGRLPWPVLKGAIVSNFGRHEHPSIKDIFIENNGIDLKTTPGANARAIFDGTVVTIFNLPTTQNCIMVKHGAYFSVYSNIVNTYVKAGDKVTAKQALGSIYTDPTDNATKLHLEIWNGKDKLNPATWLVKGN